jgi:hypothetical protein
MRDDTRLSPSALLASGCDVGARRRVLIGRQLEGRLHAAEPGVHHRLVVGGLRPNATPASVQRRVYREERRVGLPSDAEYRHQPIADELVDIAIVPLDQLADLRKVAVQKVHHIVCVDATDPMEIPFAGRP